MHYGFMGNYFFFGSFISLVLLIDLVLLGMYLWYRIKTLRGK